MEYEIDVSQLLSWSSSGARKPSKLRELDARSRFTKFNVIRYATSTTECLSIPITTREHEYIACRILATLPSVCVTCQFKAVDVLRRVVAGYDRRWRPITVLRPSTAVGNELSHVVIGDKSQTGFAFDFDLEAIGRDDNVISVDVDEVGDLPAFLSGRTTKHFWVASDIHAVKTWAAAAGGSLQRTARGTLRGHLCEAVCSSNLPISTPLSLRRLARAQRLRFVALPMSDDGGSDRVPVSRLSFTSDGQAVLAHMTMVAVMLAYCGGTVAGQRLTPDAGSEGARFCSIDAAPTRRSGPSPAWDDEDSDGADELDRLFNQLSMDADGASGLPGAARGLGAATRLYYADDLPAYLQAHSQQLRSVVQRHESKGTWPGLAASAHSHGLRSVADAADAAVLECAELLIREDEGLSYLTKIGHGFEELLLHALLAYIRAGRHLDPLGRESKPSTLGTEVLDAACLADLAPYMSDRVRRELAWTEGRVTVGQFVAANWRYVDQLLETGLTAPLHGGSKRAPPRPSGITEQANWVVSCVGVINRVVQFMPHLEGVVRGEVARLLTWRQLR